MSEKQTVFDKIRRLISDYAFSVFLWANQLTQEQYWRLTYEGWQMICPEEQALKDGEK